MKAFRIHEYGEAAKFIEDEIDKPITKSGHVLIEVKASSLNSVDHKLLKMDLGISRHSPGDVIFNGHWDIEQCHDLVSHDLVYDPVISVHVGPAPAEKLVENRGHHIGTPLPNQLRKSAKVRKKGGDRGDGTRLPVKLSDVTEVRVL